MAKRAGCKNGFMLKKGQCVRGTDHIRVDDTIHKKITKLKWGEHRESWPHLASGVYRVNYIHGKKVTLAVADPDKMFVSSKHIYDVPVDLLKKHHTRINKI